MSEFRFDVLDPDTKIEKSRFLQASAGTGKTFAIEHLFVRFLLENQTVSLEQILVVTFTRAAVRDLKNRIRKNFETILSYLRDKKYHEKAKQVFPYLRPYFEKGILQETIRRLETELALFDKAQIFTIHGFCQRMLQEFSFAASQPIDQASSMQTKVHGQKVAMDFLRYQLSEKSYHPYQLADLMKRARKNSLFVNRLMERANLQSLQQLSTSFNDRFEWFNEVLSNLKIATSQEKVVSDFEKVLSQYKITGFDLFTLRSQAKILGKLLEKRVCEKQAFEQLLSNRFSLFSFLSNENRKKKSSSGLESVHLFFESILQAFTPILEKVIDSEKLSSGISYELSKRLEEKRENEDLLTHDTILTKMEEALSHTAFKERVQKRYRVAVIDEFQDTDPVQWKIFDTLFLDSHSDFLAYYLVGDPKQSIYSFRNADLYSYLHAEERIGKEKQAYLDTNYRSSAKLISSLNYLFSKEFAKSWMPLPKLDNSLAYMPVQSGLLEKPDIEDCKAVLHFMFTEGKSSVKGWPSKQLEKETYYPSIVNEIISLKENKKLSFNNFAILVANRYQAIAVKEALESAKLPFVMRTSLSLMETQSVNSFRDIFYAVLHPYDLSAVKAAMGGLVIQMSVDEILSEEKVLWVQKQFIELQERLKEKSFSSFFAHFWSIDWKEDNESTLEKVVNKNDLSFFFHLLSLMELMEEYLDSESLFLLEEFDKLGDLDSEEEKRLNATPFFDDEGIQILTTHSSKGLEFDVVFALGIGTRSPTVDERVDLAELDAEKSRQLYVALTRAKRRVYIPFAFDEKINGVTEGKASALELFFSSILDAKPSIDLMMPVIDGLVEKGFATYEWIDRTEVLSVFQQKKVKISPISLRSLPKFPEKRIQSFTSLSAQEKREKKQYVERDDFPFSANALPPGPSSGVLLHKIFERIIKENAHYPGKEKILPLILAEVEGTSLEDFFEIIAEMVDRAFHVQLFSDNVFSLKDLPFSDAEVEMEFMYSRMLKNHSADLLKGSIDLIFSHEGKYYLLDWKSNWLGDEDSCYNRDALNLAMNDHQYFLQAEIYKQAFGRYYREVVGEALGDSFGGMIYLFLRGLSSDDETKRGVFLFDPDIKGGE